MNTPKRSTPIAAAVRHATLCAAATGLLASAGTAQALDVKLGGYVKTDLTYDLDADLGPSLAATAVPTGSGASSEESFRMHSLQSRLNFSASQGDLKVFVEADFFTGDSSELVSNSRHKRLRHAYGQVGDLLIGQTWSTFMDKNWVLYPSTVDFAGPAGATFIRQSMIRWSFDNGWDFALENPENRVIDPAVDADADGEGDNLGRDTLPDVVLRYAQTGDLSWQVAGLFQQFEVDGGAADGEREDNIGLSGGINVNTGGNNSFSIKANVNSNRYTYYGFANPAAVVEGSDIELVDHGAVVAAYNIDWGDARTTIAYGTVSFDDDHLDGTSAEDVSTFHLNYRWSPYENVDFGVELSWADLELVNGDDGDATRLQFGAQYNL